MALAHKGLAVETVPWRFIEKDKLPQPNAGRVSVIVDGGRVVDDSTAIADYLEERYPDRQSLIRRRSRAGVGALRAELDRNGIADWADPPRRTRHPPPLHAGGPGLFPAVARRALRRQSGRCCARPRGTVPAFRTSLDPLRRTVERQDFISGKAPAYADYVVFGAFQWVRAISDFEVLAADDPVRVWRSRMLDLFDGLARRAPAYGD